MNVRRIRGSRSRRQEGYALLMVVFMSTALLIAAMLIAPSILTEGKREKEKDMIWRGKQYARGVKLYYRKMGRFPTSLDDLTKPKVGSLRFLRQAYKDPMNTKDGSWRLIYVGPAGNLIGSLKPPQQNLQFNAPGIGTPVSSLAAPGAPGNAGQGGLFGLGQPGQPGAGMQGSGFGQPGQPGTPGSGSGTNPPGITGAPVSADQGTAPGSPAIPMGDTPQIVGGNIIGVGSKINKSSVIVYEKAKNYRLFEFIWDPSKDMMGVGQAGMQTGTGLGQIPGTNPIGQPVNPQQNPTNPQQNPQQPQQQNPQQ
ncbi:MAG TPA: hypothetical protein VE263_16880 [Candidatus Angelobacter sp.]|nr:hypothetical protein [Candidatus Angelobacter sp.]